MHFVTKSRKLLLSPLRTNLTIGGIAITGFNVGIDNPLALTSPGLVRSEPEKYNLSRINFRKKNQNQIRRFTNWTVTSFSMDTNSGYI